MLPTEPFYTRTRNLSQKTAANSNSYPKLRFHDLTHTFRDDRSAATTMIYVHHVLEIDAAEKRSQRMGDSLGRAREALSIGESRGGFVVFPVALTGARGEPPMTARAIGDRNERAEIKR